MSRRALPALTAAVALLAAVPAAAGGAVVATDKPCYLVGESVGVTLSAMPANELIDLRVDDNYLSSVTVDGAGAFSGTFGAPGFDGSSTTNLFTLLAGSSLSVYAQTTFSVTRFGVTMSPASARPTSAVRFRAFGFTEKTPVYLHVVRKISDTRHVAVATLNFGMPTGACGEVSRRIKQLPLSNKQARPGVYDLQFDLSKSYHRQQGRYVERPVYVAKRAPR